MKQIRISPQTKDKSVRMAKAFVASAFKYVMLLCIAFIIIYPLISRFSNSFKSYDDLMDKTVILIPKSWSLVNYLLAANAMKFVESFKNSLTLSMLVTLLQVFFCSFIAYGFARFKFPLKNVIYAFVIFSLLIPPQTIMTSQYMQFRYFDFLGIIESITGKPWNFINTTVPFTILSITGFGLKNGLYIYLLTQFYRGIPKELEEAALVDGANPFRIYFKIMVPTATPMLLTVLLFSFSWQWTDTYYSKLFLSRWWTLPLSVGAISTAKNSTLDPAVIIASQDAALMLILAPLIVLYLFTQKYFVQGIEKSGIVG